MTKNNVAELFFLFCLNFDLLTTFIGLFIDGIQEGNIFGLKGVILLNSLLILMFIYIHYKADDEDKKQIWFIVPLILVGIIRLCCAISNLILIIWVVTL